MELVKPDLNINFTRMFKGFVIFSTVLTLICVITFFTKGFKYGIDFAGGTLVQIKFTKNVPADDLRNILIGIGISDAILQPFGTNEIVVRTAESTSDLKGLSAKMDEALTKAYGKDSFSVQRVEVVGPKVGADLTRKAIMAVLFSWLGMLIYIAIRFELRFAVGGIVGVIHDVIVVLGVFAMLGKEFTLTVVAALLTVIGYSIHDSIVLFDRVRENRRKDAKKDMLAELNVSINQTMSRTILTSLTVVLVVAALYVFGGAVINDFAFVLLIGVIFGTYSSVFIASPVVLAWDKLWPARPNRKK